jgi:hypothetical protein
MVRLFRTKRLKTRTSIDAGVEQGFRSGLEDLNAEVLIRAGVDVEYEAYKLKFEQPAKVRTYTPDFILPNGIVIETKGHFTTADRQKHLMIRACHPNLDLRFVFSNANTKISKQSKTSYADWADHKGFKWANSTIPKTWIKERTLVGRVEAARAALGWVPPWERT